MVNGEGIPILGSRPMLQQEFVVIHLSHHQILITKLQCICFKASLAKLKKLKVPGFNFLLVNFEIGIGLIEKEK